jgi:bacteriorhodopsin
MISVLFLLIVLALSALTWSNAVRSQKPEPNVIRELSRAFIYASVLWLLYFAVHWIAAGNPPALFR